MNTSFTPIATLLSSARAGSSPVALCGTQTIVWRDFEASVLSLTERLKNTPLQRWLLCHDDAYLFAVGFFALLHSGKKIILPPNSQRGTLLELAVNADGLLAEIGTSVDDFPVIHIECSKAYKHTESETIDTKSCFSALSVNNVRVELMTSGSTGKAKVIEKKLCHLDKEIQCLESLWGKELDEAVFFSTVSHQHIYGLLFRVLWPLCAGRVLVSTTYHYPEQLFTDIKKQQKVAIISSPAHLERIPNSINLKPYAHSVVQMFSSGGALDTVAALQLKERIGRAPVEILGSSETGGVAFRCQKSVQSPVAWTLLPGVEAREGANDKALEIASPFAYLNGWVAMGDKVEFIAPSRFFLRGRIDLIEKVEGKRLSLTQMEAQLSACALIEKARVVVLHGQRESVAAVVVLSEVGREVLNTAGKHQLNMQIREYLSQFFDRVLLPKKFRYLNALPSNSQSKVLLNDLLSLFDKVSEIQKLPITVVSQQADTVLLGITLSPDSEVFLGHFPELPILAGVTQVDIAVRKAQEYFYPQSVFKRIERMKFKQVIRPDTNLQLEIKSTGKGCVKFTYFAAEEKLSVGQIHFGQNSHV